MPEGARPCTMGAMTATVASPSVVPQAEGTGRYWWLAMAAGVFTMAVGLFALVFPEPTLLVVGLMFGAYLVAWGAMAGVRGAVGTPGMPGVVRILLVLVGVLSVFAGLLLLVRPGQSVLTAAWVLGFWWVLEGVLQLIRGIAVPEGRAAHLALGLLGATAGAIILAQPEIGLVTLVWIVAIGLLFHGAIEIALGWQLRHLHKEGVA